MYYINSVTRESKYNNHKVIIKIDITNKNTYFGKCTIQQASGDSISHRGGGITPTFSDYKEYDSDEKLMNVYLKAAHYHIDNDFEVFKKISDDKEIERQLHNK